MDDTQTIELAHGWTLAQHPGKQAMIARFAEAGGSVRRAAEMAGVNWTTHYDWMQQDPEYAAAFNAMRPVAAQFLEDEATRRAFEGYERGIYWHGTRVDVIREYSDSLLVRRLEAELPEKYRRDRELLQQQNVQVKVYSGLPDDDNSGP